MRDGRVDFDAYQALREGLEQRVRALQVVELTAAVARDAGDLAERHGLGPRAAVHLATAHAVRFQLDEFVLVSWDGRLARAARRDGLPVAPDPG